ncbi:ATP-binding cassette domain-containing protein [Prolixibacteraceae bacterium JC049]|jgi:cell division transport system ATP-binding protein|nr:ATP-binding cassette domain-containing protein [Prolixibacteraceae bacterium JC049]
MSEQTKIISIEKADIWQYEHVVLTNINLDIEKGEWVYLIGKVGSGKTSLIKTLNAELPLRKGNATIVDHQLHDIKRKEIPFLRRKLGVIFQDFKLLTDRNIEANLQFVLEATGWKEKRKISDRINEVLEMVGMANVTRKMPHQLSGGEQQRIAIARALLNDPEVILADEPTGHLDPETSEELMQLFKQINEQGKTLLIATHDYLMFNKFPNRTIIFENGSIKEIEQSQESIDFDTILA